MAKNLDDLKKEIIELEKNIAIYEESYNKFNTVYENIKSKTLTDEEERVISEFKTFCYNEGIYTGNNWGKWRYNRSKEQIDDRLDTMKKRLAIIKEYQEIEENMQSLKLSDSTMNSIKEIAGRKYTEGTEEYNNYLQKLVNRQKEIEHDRLVNSNDAIKQKETALKKENGRVQVLKSIIPGGNGLYNLYAKVHNANARFQRDHKVLNAIVKMGLPVAVFLTGVSLVSSMGLVAFSIPGIAALAAFPAEYISLKHIFSKESRENHLKILEEKKTKVKRTLSDAIFKFRKARGKSSIVTEDKLYSGIDFGKFETREEIKEDSDKLDLEEEKDLDKEEVKETSESSLTPSKDEVKEEDVKSEEDTFEEKIDDDSYTKSETLDVKEETKEPSSTTYERHRRSDKHKETSTTETKKEKKVKTTDVVSEEPKYVINDLSDVMSACEYFDKNGINTLEDYNRFKTVINYLEEEGIKKNNHKYIELAENVRFYGKTISKELKERILITERFNDLDLPRRNSSVFNAYKKKTENARNDAFTKIINLINSSESGRDISEEIYELHKGYIFTPEMESKIREALNERNDDSKSHGRR